MFYNMGVRNDGRQLHIQVSGTRNLYLFSSRKIPKQCEPAQTPTALITHSIPEQEEPEILNLTIPESKNEQEAVAQADRWERAQRLIEEGYTFWPESDPDQIAVCKPGRLVAEYWSTEDGCNCPDAAKGSAASTRWPPRSWPTADANRAYLSANSGKPRNRQAPEPEKPGSLSGSILPQRGTSTP